VISAEDRVAIGALHESWLDAELRGESSALLQLCTAAPVWLPPDEAPLCGRAAIARWLEEQPGALIERVEVDELQMSGNGALACTLASFRTTSRTANGSGSYVVTGSHAWLLQKDAAGDWRVAVVTWHITGASPLRPG
jgi:ketosteroid isomerase-like protein